MNKILAFDSMYIVNPLRKVYMVLIEKILNEKETTNSRLVLYRLDQDNVLIRDGRNISGMAIGAHQDHIDAMSIKFYQYLEKSLNCDALTIKNLQMYKLYNRQVKLKLAGVLRCAYRIRNLSIDSEDNIQVITDRQTVSIMEEAFLFLNYVPKNITWKTSRLLTACITINSLVMRFAALVKMLVSQSILPKEYYHKHVDSNAPTVLIAMPRRRPEDFFLTYVEELGSQFNIVLYSHGFLNTTPKNYKRIKVKRTMGFLRGIFNIKKLCWNSDSYIADILLIFFNHSNLSMSIDVVNSIFTNNIDVLINRQQTNVLDNYLTIKAKRRGIFILGDIFEEVFYCDSAVVSSKSQHTEALKLALAEDAKVAYKGSNSLIKYRLKDFSNKQDRYLHKLLGVDTRKKIIFYASDPVKEESQRYLTEKFLMGYFSSLKEFIFVIKTHTQDNGKVTNYAYLDSGSPSNVILIGDIRQKSEIISKQFNLFDEFDFNAAVSSSDGFLTTSSSSILQALVLGIKSGIVDKFNNGYYDYLVNYKATMLINSRESLGHFLDNKKLDISDDTLSYCGLNNENENFDLGEHLLKCFHEFHQHKENKQQTAK
jgi:hypothetical protein